MTFEELGLKPEILKALQELGFENPMPVQEKVIPLLLSKNTDIVALAQTGTGKTAAFGLPIVEQTDTMSKQTQALVLAPTRELCLQIADDLNDYSKYVDNLSIVPVYGGASIEVQIKALRKGAQIIVATPGRLIDLINRGVARLENVTKVVLDEADEMLNMGFEDDLKTILAQIPETRNTLLFSATMPPAIASIAKHYMSNPQEVTIGQRNTGAENVKHVCYTVHAKDKYHALKRIADFYPNIYAIVFCRTRKETQEVADKLMHDGYNADALHGDLSQAQRDFVMNRFRTRQISMLVATDVAARGIDVNSLTHVINYNLPDDVEIYTHRSGRTGRAGKTGISIAIINLREKHVIRQIEKIINKKFELQNIPSGIGICEKQLFHLIDKLERVEVEETEIAPFLTSTFKRLEWLDKEEIIKRFISLEFNRFLEYYKKMPDLEIPSEQSRRDGQRDSFRDSFREGGRDGYREGKREGRREASGPRTAEKGFSRLFLNLGKEDGLYPPDLIELLNQHSQGRRVKVGRIELMKKFSFFEVPEQDAQFVVDSMKGASVSGRRVAVDYASSGENEGNQNDRGHGDFKRSGERSGFRKFGERGDRGDRKRFDNDRGGRSERPERTERSAKPDRSEGREKSGFPKEEKKKYGRKKEDRR